MSPAFERWAVLGGGVAPGVSGSVPSMPVCDAHARASRWSEWVSFFVSGFGMDRVDLPLTLTSPGSSVLVSMQSGRILAESGSLRVVGFTAKEFVVTRATALAVAGLRPSELCLLVAVGQERAYLAIDYLGERIGIQVSASPTDGLVELLKERATLDSAALHGTALARTLASALRLVQGRQLSHEQGILDTRDFIANMVAARRGSYQALTGQLFQELVECSQWRYPADGDNRIMPLLVPRVGCEAAFECAVSSIVCANLGLVASRVRHLRQRRRHSLGPEDVFQAGVMGLHRAVIRFDVSRGIQFSTYAVHWIDQSIKREFATTDKFIRIPTHVSKDEYIEPIVECCGSILADLESAVGMNSAAVSSRDDTTSCLHALDVTEAITEALLALDADQAKVLIYRYGLLKQDEATLLTLGNAMGISGERVRQIQADAESAIQFRLLKLKEDV